MKPFKVFEGGKLDMIKISEIIYDDLSNHDNDFDGKMHEKQLNMKKG